MHAPGAIERRRRAARPSGEAATPAAQSTVRAAMRSPPSATPASSMPVTRAPVRTSTPEALELRAAPSRDSSSRVRRQHARGRLEQDHARAARVDAAEVARQGVARDLGQRARQLDAGGPAADHHEGEPAAGALSASASRSACSKASRTRRRISRASSSVLRPGACAAHSSWPK